MPDIQTELIEFPSAGGVTPGYLALPGGEQARPGVIVLQEWWGLVPHIEDVSRRFASAGFVALAPDLYHGQHATEPDEARKLRMAMNGDQAVGEIRAASEFLSLRADVWPKRVGVVGWCMGGGLALSAAADGAKIGAAVAFYGHVLAAEDAARLHVPVLGLYAEHDHGITPDEVHQFEAELEKLGIEHDIHIYPGTQHAFFNDDRPEVYDAQASEDAWVRTLDWFRRYLKSEAS